MAKFEMGDRVRVIAGVIDELTGRTGTVLETSIYPDVCLDGATPMILTFMEADLEPVAEKEAE